jgi:hypothetical protein
MTGCGRRTICCIISLHAVITCMKKARPRSGSERRCASSFKSCPAEKAGPFAASTTARIARSRAIASNASPSATIIAADRLLRASGRFSVRVAIASIVSRNTIGAVVTAVLVIVYVSNILLPVFLRHHAAPDLSPIVGGAPSDEPDDDLWDMTW